MGNIDILLSIGDLVDRLSIENIKCYDANTRILEERAKAHPNAERISALEWKARSSGEIRVRLRYEINLRLKDALERGTIDVQKEVRTYDLNKVATEDRSNRE
jgi:hypothetical protein